MLEFYLLGVFCFVFHWWKNCNSYRLCLSVCRVCTKGRGQIPESHPFSVPQWHCCYYQRIFVLWSLRPITKKVCFFLPLALLLLLCMCHHVLGKYFDVILAFCRLIPLRAPLDVEARIQQSAHAMLSLN